MFEPIQSKRVYQHVIDQIQKQIFSGELVKGDRLPPERELTEQLGASRTSVREALRALEVIGLVETRPGEGNYISGTIENSFLEPLTSMFMLNKGTSKDILEMRTVIEMKAAELAAERITDEQIEHLNGLLNDMFNSETEKNKADYDKKLHYYITEITGNILMINMLNVISSMMELFVQTSRRKILEDSSNREILFNHHKNIVNAIVSRKPKEAKDCMEAHMNMINDIVHP